MISIESQALTSQFIAGIQELSKATCKEENSFNLPKKRMRWTKKESKQLISLKTKDPDARWESISEHFPQYSLSQVRRHYYTLVNSPNFSVPQRVPFKLLKNGYLEVPEDLSTEEKQKRLTDLREQLSKLEQLIQESNLKVQDFFEEIDSN